MILNINKFIVSNEWVATQFCNGVLSLITGNVQLEDSFDLSILNENLMVPQSSLAFNLEWLAKEGNLAAVVIMKFWK